jgi:hypothetical protein
VDSEPILGEASPSPGWPRPSPQRRIAILDARTTAALSAIGGY